MNEVRRQAMGRYLVFAFALFAYVVFFVTFLYLPAFLVGSLVPKTIDSGEQIAWGIAVPINSMLIVLFAAQHTIMARPAFKTWWTKWVPKPMERGVFVLAASVLLLFLYWQWRPMPSVIWSVESPLPYFLLAGVCVMGFLLALYSSFLIDHFELFGLRQAWNHLRGIQPPAPRFTVKSAYRYIRHPLMAGLLIMVWAAPTMTAGHLFFALMITGYIFVGVAFEERDLIHHLGAEYQRYRARTPMLIPWPRKSRSAEVSDDISGQRLPAGSGPID
jgi:methanethiol S-methyltransferase